LLGQLPKPADLSVINCAKRNALLGFGSDCEGVGKPKMVVKKLNDILFEAAKPYPNVEFIDPTPYICDGGVCNYLIDGKSIFMTDGVHLSGFGSEQYWRYILSRIHDGSKLGSVGEKYNDEKN
jgi:hypothetical protein